MGMPTNRAAAWRTLSGTSSPVTTVGSGARSGIGQNSLANGDEPDGNSGRGARVSTSGAGVGSGAAGGTGVVAAGGAGVGTGAGKGSDDGAGVGTGLGEGSNAGAGVGTGTGEGSNADAGVGTGVGKGSDADAGVGTGVGEGSDAGAGVGTEGAATGVSEVSMGAGGDTGSGAGFKLTTGSAFCAAINPSSRRCSSRCSARRGRNWRTQSNQRTYPNQKPSTEKNAAAAQGTAECRARKMTLLRVSMVFMLQSKPDARSIL